MKEDRQRISASMHPRDNIQRLPPISNRKWIIQDGGRRCGNSHISACRRDSNEISTVRPIRTFSSSSNLMQIWWMLYDQTGSGKSKTAAALKRKYSPRLADVATILDYCPLQVSSQSDFMRTISLFGSQNIVLSVKISLLSAIEYASWNISISGSTVAVLDYFRLPVVRTVISLALLDCLTPYTEE